MKPRLYFDTSVFGGVYDEEFEEISTLLFEKVKLGQIVCVYSDLSEAELQNAPQRVRECCSGIFMLLFLLEQRLVYQL